MSSTSSFERRYGGEDLELVGPVKRLRSVKHLMAEDELVIPYEKLEPRKEVCSIYKYGGGQHSIDANETRRPPSEPGVD